MTSTATALSQSRRVLERELADYSSAADRDALAALLDGRGATDSFAAVILSRQAHRELFRTR